MRKQVLFIALLASLLAVDGCSSRGTKHSSAGAGSEGTTAGAGASGKGGRGHGGTASGRKSSGVAGITEHIIYFDFDSATLKPESQAVVDSWSKYLTANPNAKVRLEGHTDERGTREYNVGLGERRANAVQQALAAHGAGAAQINVISFGEERPVALGHDEASWSQNRRVEIID